MREAITGEHVPILSSLSSVSSNLSPPPFAGIVGQEGKLLFDEVTHKRMGNIKENRERKDEVRIGGEEEKEKRTRRQRR